MFATCAYLALLTCLVAPALGTTYSQTDSFQGSDFLSGFIHQAIADPTHGRNLTYASGDTLILRADDTTVLSASDPGRNSVRLMSNNVYSNHVTIWNIRHMPEGCGTWPAVWEVGQDWPDQGEIDILEGVNDDGTDQATLHTGSNCTVGGLRTMTGTSTGDNCDVNATGNSGCGVKSNDASSYGPTFNAAGGGFYAMERSDAGVKVWFWSRNSGSIPSDVLSGATSVDTDDWGTPFADFPSTSCDMASHFGPHNIVINLTFCGDWAGAVFEADGCPGDCTTYVDENPGAFANAYFDVAWLRVYQ
ncbi:endo-1,3(4)-beta-glucanase-like protein [Dichomitus squalens]|uniref:Endo-1,3(4)-beta-glucanase-like protein n=1 Tax=Dichomitus squalens TaxID=114155 RepID=A0A4Q9M5N6_9APHY|nr:endo-1,3(4)-beta-glucanase-like protein [Dichomitus squalens]